jgi:cytochrome c oxidase assembly factor CtaG
MNLPPAGHLAAALPPPLTWHRFGTVRFDVGGALILIVAVAYGLGVVAATRRDPAQPWSAKRTFAFFCGLVVTFIAVEGFVGVYDDTLFYDHMIQHLMLIMIAAPLFAMGAPAELLERATTGRAHDMVEKGLGSKVAEFVAHPITDFVAYAIVVPLTHLTSFFNVTVLHQSVSDLEHLLFLAVGYLFWRHVVAIEPTRHRLHPGVQLLYLALAVPVDTFTGLALASLSTNPFPAYAALHRTWGPSLLTDIHAGGSIMWVGGDTLMFIAMIPVAVRWMRSEEHRATEVDRQLEALGGGDARGVTRVPWDN